MRLTCPWCGPRDQEEFLYGGDASARRPDHDDSDPEAWLAYLYERENPCGPHREYWQHEAGCRRWLEVTRDTLTHEILAVALLEGERP
ncbi:MAG: sarcosine oxidase subunit delta [Rhodospirillales bacterium]